VASITHVGAPEPLIVTLRLLDRAAQERFDALRERHFPPERNHLRAHVTLFHALPGSSEQVAADLADGRARRVRRRGERLRSLGRGVAYDLRSAELQAVRARLARPGRRG
jgi:hypothetical protein